MAKREVSNLEVARHYLKSEFGHIFPDQAEQLYDAIDQFHDNKVWRLCEALSTFYRLNAVWWVINGRGFKWTFETVPVDRVVLTGVGDNPLNKLIHSEQIARDPIKLKAYLLDYYVSHPNDPKAYAVKPTNQPIRWPQIMLVEVKGGLRVVDGMHRFIETLLCGAAEVEAYVARPIQPVDKLKPTGGRGAIWLLDNLAKALPEESTSIREISKILAEQSMFESEFNHHLEKDDGHE